MMYRMIIVTALGNYVVEMVPEKEEPTADELMKMFLETKADVESGCFMEGWTRLRPVPEKRLWFPFRTFPS